MPGFHGRNPRPRLRKRVIFFGRRSRLSFGRARRFATSTLKTETMQAMEQLRQRPGNIIPGIPTPPRRRHRNPAYEPMCSSVVSHIVASSRVLKAVRKAIRSFSRATPAGVRARPASPVPPGSRHHGSRRPRSRRQVACRSSKKSGQSIWIPSACSTNTEISHYSTADAMQPAIYPLSAFLRLPKRT